MSKINRVFLQEEGQGKLSSEISSLYQELEARKYPITLFTKKKLYRRQLPLNRQSFLAGDIPIVLSALKQLKIPEPKTNDYPASLQKFLHRKIWESSLASLESKLYQGIEQPIFAKPARRRKQFSGRVFNSFHDLWYVSGVSRKEEIFCSEVVSWISEYRVYIIHSKIVGIHCYSENSNISLNETIVLEAIRSLEEAGESVAGYSLDFGVLETGETALVEMNEGFSLGNYGLNNKTYTDLILARWEELLSGLEDTVLY